MSKYLDKTYQELQVEAKNRGLKAFRLSKVNLAALLDENDVAVGEEFEELEEPLNVQEPRVFQAGSDEAVSEIHVLGGAPEGLSLNDYLVMKKITFGELENVVTMYANSTNVSDRVSSIEGLKNIISTGEKKAKEIVDSGETSVEIKDIHVADALRRGGWRTTRTTDDFYYMEKS